MPGFVARLRAPPPQPPPPTVLVLAPTPAAAFATPPPVAGAPPSATSIPATATEAATATPDGGPTSTIAPPPTTAAPPTRPPTPFGGGTVVASPTGPVPRTPAPLPAPVPSEPQENANVTGKIKFVWDYLGQLQPGQAFEVRIWAEGATEHLGAAPSVTTQETTIDLDWAPGIVAKEKEKGVYLWAVAVIEKATGARIGRESEPRHFRYSPGGCVGACRY